MSNIGHRPIFVLIMTRKFILEGYNRRRYLFRLGKIKVSGDILVTRCPLVLAVFFSSWKRWLFAEFWHFAACEDGAILSTVSTPLLADWIDVKCCVWFKYQVAFEPSLGSWYNGVAQQGQTEKERCGRWVGCSHLLVWPTSAKLMLEEHERIKRWIYQRTFWRQWS